MAAGGYSQFLAYAPVPVSAFSVARSHPVATATSFTSLQISLPNEDIDEAEQSVRHRRTQAEVVTPHSSLPESPQRLIYRRQHSGYQPEDYSTGTPVHWANRYSLRPARIIRTMSGDTTPGGTCHFAAVLERSGSLNGMSSVRLPTEGECAICFEFLKSGDQVQPMVHCSHIFHKHCIDAYIQARVSSLRMDGSYLMHTRISCPMCRGPMMTSCLSEVPESERLHVQPLRNLSSS
jgi:hypothetical protein